MYARMLTVRVGGISEEKMEEAIANYRDIVPDGAREIDGFREAIMLVDRPNDRVVSLTFWRDEECCEAGVANSSKLAQQVMQKTGIQGEVLVDTFEVAVRAD